MEIQLPDVEAYDEDSNSPFYCRGTRLSADVVNGVSAKLNGSSPRLKRMQNPLLTTVQR